MIINNNKNKLTATIFRSMSVSSEFAFCSCACASCFCCCNFCCSSWRIFSSITATCCSISSSICVAISVLFSFALQAKGRKFLIAPHVCLLQIPATIYFTKTIIDDIAFKTNAVHFGRWGLPVNILNGSTQTSHLVC